MKLWVAKRRIQYFKTKRCRFCGSTKTLELDHINPIEKESHRIWTWSKERQKEELKKCRVLCHKCHKERHRRPLQHGTEYVYCNYACRCNKCKEAHSLHLKKYR